MSLFLDFTTISEGFPGGRESTCWYKRHWRLGFYPWVGKILWRMKWQPTPAFLPRKIPWTEEPGRLQVAKSWTWLSNWACTVTEDKNKHLCALGVKKGFFPIKIWSQKKIWKQYLMSIPDVNLHEKKTRFGKLGFLLTFGFAPIQKYCLEAFEMKPHMTEKFSLNSWAALWLGAETQWWAASLSNPIPESTNQVMNYRQGCQFPPSEWNHTRS